MKKSILRGLASALALAVALVAPNVAAVTAYAEDDTSSDDTTTTVEAYDGTQKIEKTYTNSNSTEEVTFTFKLEYDHVEAINGNTPENPTFGTQSEGATWYFDESGDGSSSGVYYTTTTIKAKSDGETVSGASIKSLLESVTFTTPGTYYFTLSEVAGSNPNVSYDTTTYTVKVEVVWATDSITGAYILDEDDNMTVTVASYTIYDSDGDKQDSADFKNTAADSASLKVTKDIQGAGANPSDTFTFTITVTGVSGTYTIEILDGVTVSAGDNDTTVTPITDDDGTITGYTVTASSGGTIVLTVVMGDDDYIVIKGLPSTAIYSVTESTTGSESSKTYTSSLGDSNSDGTSNASTGNITSSGATVDVVNTLGFTVDTGVTLYLTVFGVVAVVAAAGIALVVVRRRRSYDEF